MEVVEVHRAHDLPIVFDDPPELSGRVEVLVPAAQRIECSAGIGGGCAGH